MASLPYVASAGTIEKALKAIQQAATPPTVSQDFVKTILGIKGGPGNQITSYLRKIGFANADGSPTELYKKFRNSATAGSAAAEAIRIGYKPLYTRNEYMHALPDEKLRGLIVEETGASAEAPMVSCVMYCIKQLKKFAKWTEEPTETPGKALADTLPAPARPEQPWVNPQPPPLSPPAQGLSMNLGYTINLNLPATSDVSVFNAIFKSLKENLLRGSNE